MTAGLWSHPALLGPTPSYVLVGPPLQPRPIFGTRAEAKRVLPCGSAGRRTFTAYCVLVPRPSCRLHVCHWKEVVKKSFTEGCDLTRSLCGVQEGKKKKKKKKKKKMGVTTCFALAVASRVYYVEGSR